MINRAGAPGRHLLPTLTKLFGQIFYTRRISLNGNYNAEKFPATVHNMSSMPSELVAPVTTILISLTPRESQLRSLLLDVARYIDESKEIKERLELRFAGGWVRDKLLNIPSHDIDTAINAMTGSSFTFKMKQFLEDPRNMAKHELGMGDVGMLHKIAANPEKSKHLETVTTKILGFDVDFVNLRKESYDEHSRNPRMQFGTALEDAQRRDATVNALFYNLHTNKVEDYTGGLHDMEAKLMRTPLDPYQTFKDDPLRILRLIRFASRLGFSIHAESETCMGNPSILSALRLKISRERIGSEIEKMLKGPNPRNALNYIDKLGLYPTIFTDPTANTVPNAPTNRWKVACDCLELLRSNESPGSINKLLIRSEDAVELAWIFAALSPLAMVTNPASSKVGGKLPLPYATIVAREGIKLNNRVCDAVTAAFRNREEISSFKRAVNDKESWTYERDKLGMAIRRWDAPSGHWEVQVLLAIIVEAMTSSEYDRFEALLGGWQQFVDHLKEMEILNAPSWKRLIDGTQLAKDLGVKPGRWMAAALDVCMAWQFRNPQATDPAGAIEEVKRRADEMEIPRDVSRPGYK